MKGVNYAGHEACAASIVKVSDGVVFRRGL